MTVPLVDLLDSYEASALSALDPTNAEDGINFWKEANENDPDELSKIKKSNAKAIKEIFLRANAAPPNLRYGDGSSNSGIVEDFDPMGDAKGEITKKEKELLQKYVISHETDEFDGVYYLRSSTGVYQPDDKSMNRWFIKCLENNAECV